MSRSLPTRSVPPALKKAVLFSTNGFQRGAIEYAQKHGVALVRVLEGALTYETRAASTTRVPSPRWANVPPFVAQYMHESGPGTIAVTVIQPILVPTSSNS